MAANADSFVPVTGVVHLPTALGVFLDVGERRLFLRYADTSTSRRHFIRGENVTLDVRTWRKWRDSSRVDREREGQRGYSERPTVTSYGALAPVKDFAGLPWSETTRLRGSA